MDKSRFLYRGKPKSKNGYLFFKKVLKEHADDTFIYGNLLIDQTDKYFIAIPLLAEVDSHVVNGKAIMVEVFPETVGQYTGMKDDNNTMIFEQDILGCNANLYLVSYMQGGFVCTETHDKNPTHFRTLNALVNFRDPEEIVEVVGNKFDNPELLSREEMTKQILEEIEMIKKQRSV